MTRKEFLQTEKLLEGLLNCKSEAHRRIAVAMILSFLETLVKDQP